MERKACEFKSDAVPPRRSSPKPRILLSRISKPTTFPGIVLMLDGWEEPSFGLTRWSEMEADAASEMVKRRSYASAE